MQSKKCLVGSLGGRAVKCYDPLWYLLCSDWLTLYVHRHILSTHIYIPFRSRYFSLSGRASVRAGSWGRCNVGHSCVPVTCRQQHWLLKQDPGHREGGREKGEIDVSQLQIQFSVNVKRGFLSFLRFDSIYGLSFIAKKLWDGQEEKLLKKWKTPLIRCVYILQ